MISELITFRITKAKAKVEFRVMSLCGHDCERSSVPININAKAKATKYYRGINFTLISVSTVPMQKTLPTRKKFYPNYFVITVTRFEISQFFVLKIARYLMYLCELREYHPPRTPVFVELFYITVTRLEVFRIKLGNVFVANGTPALSLEQCPSA